MSDGLIFSVFGCDVQYSDAVACKAEVPLAVFGCGTQGDVVACKGLGDFPVLAFEPEVSVFVDLSQQFTVVIFRHWRGLGHGTRAWGEAGCGGGEAKRFVGPLVVIDGAPEVKGLLAVLKAVKAAQGKHFGLEAAVEAFVLSLGLGVVGAAMADPDAEPQQPDAKHGPAGFGAGSGWHAPGRTIVAEQAARQAVVAENRGQPGLDRLGLLVGTGLQPQGKAAVVIQQGQGMAPATPGGEMALEIHLPQIVGSRMFKALERLLARRGRLETAAPRQKPFKRFEHPRPNDLWQMDFKGHFAAGGGRCHPLTLLDDHSRFALGLEACANEQSQTVQARLTTIFRHNGLPRRLLCDNGAPWGVPSRTSPETGWTVLGVWLLRLGVRVSHGRPYHPQTQGKDERFHRSLKAEVLALRSFDSLEHCQKAFDLWRTIYNHERPHEALGLATPATRFTPSPRTMPETPPMPEYDDGELLRKINKDGYFRFKGQNRKISQAFAGYHIALRPTAKDGQWNLCFASHRIGILDITAENRKDQTVRHVSEQVSDMSPV